MTAVVMIVMLLGGALIQSLAPPVGWLGEAKAPVLAAVAVCYALGPSEGRMLAAALGAGLIQDALSPIPLGYSALWLCVAGFLIHRTRGIIFSDSWAGAAVLGAAVAGGITVAIYFSLTMGDEEWIRYGWTWVIRKAGGTAALGAGVTPPLFFVITRVERALGIEWREAAS